MSFIGTDEFNGAGANQVFAGHKALGQNVNDYISLTPDTSAVHTHPTQLTPRSPLLPPSRARYELLRNIQIAEPKSTFGRYAGSLLRQQDSVARAKLSTSVVRTMNTSVDIFLRDAARQRPELMTKADPTYTLRDSLAPNSNTAQRNQSRYAPLKSTATGLVPNWTRPPTNILSLKQMPTLANNLFRNSLQKLASHELATVLIPTASMAALALRPALGSKKRPLLAAPSPA